MRLAGTCSRYSNRATPQLARAAMIQGLARSSLRWAYQAKVMKTLLRVSMRMVRPASRMGHRDRERELARTLQHEKAAGDQCCARDRPNRDNGTVERRPPGGPARPGPSAAHLPFPRGLPAPCPT